MINYIFFLSTFFIVGCSTITNVKNYELRGKIYDDDRKIAPQKPPNVDNTITLWF
jgi:hypothetical protein